MDRVDAPGLIAELEAAGVRLWEEEGGLRYRAPRGVMTEERLAVLRAQRPALLDELRRAAGEAAVVPRPEARFEPFPLTDVQSAYLGGRGATHPHRRVGLPRDRRLPFCRPFPPRLRG